MVQIKFTAAALIAAAAIAPVVASSYYADDSLVTREEFDEINDVMARELGVQFDERDFEEYGSEVFTREFEDLLEREPLFPKFIKKFWANRKARKDAKKQQAMEQQQPAEGSSYEGREFDEDDLYVREVEDDLYAREIDDALEEMMAREPLFGWFKKHILRQKPKTEEVDTTDFSAREFDDEVMEVEARELDTDYEDLLTRYWDDLYERELAAAEAELEARDFEMEEAELAAREPNIGDWFRKLFHIGGKKDKKKEEKKADKEADSADAEAREFDDLD